MWRLRTLLLLLALFAAASGLLYFVHYTIFKDTHHIFIFMLGDLAFLPLEVFLVVVVIERILARRERMAIRQKMNMVVGAFFSEIGTELLQALLHCFHGKNEIEENLAVRQDWSHADFQKAMAYADSLKYNPDCQAIDLDELKTLLVGKRQFLLSLLQNPSMMEHERFTDLLWATFHLTEELEARAILNDLPASDLGHISADIERLYSRLVIEWIAYTEHLRTSYPYLFSLLTRTQPFQEFPSAVVST